MQTATRVSYYIDDQFVKYPTKAPFHPDESFPEYRGEIFNEENRVYRAIRENFKLLKYDEENYGTPEWNPLGHVISPGNTVLLKPNFVIHKNFGEGTVWSVITHPAVLRAVLDYAYIALQGKGKIIIADAPQADANFDEILKQTQLQSLVDYYKDKFGFEILVYDLRQLRFEYKNGVLLSDSRIELDGDPEGYTIFDLGEHSFFNGIENPERIYGADYDRKETIQHHSNGKHEYCISNSVINADVVISLPKMKTHRKAGITLNCKNFVGINGNKNFLPHYRIGDPSDGGDEFEPLSSQERRVKKSSRFLIDNLLVKPNKIKSALYCAIFKTYRLCKKLLKKDKIVKKDTSGGGWYGNDTLWRTILDLNIILEYGTSNGEISHQKQRRLFSVIDGMIAGEGNGPLAPDDKACGTIVMGEDLFLVDTVTAKLMGIDWKKIKVYSELYERSEDVRKRTEQLEVICNPNEMSATNCEKVRFDFREADGWIGRIKA